jgi:hypothetical protein
MRGARSPEHLCLCEEAGAYLELLCQPKGPRLLVERLAVVDDVDVAAEVRKVSLGVQVEVGGDGDPDVLPGRGEGGEREQAHGVVVVGGCGNECGCRDLAVDLDLDLGLDLGRVWGCFGGSAGLPAPPGIVVDDDACYLPALAHPCAVSYEETAPLSRGQPPLVAAAGVEDALQLQLAQLALLDELGGERVPERVGGGREGHGAARGGACGWVHAGLERGPIRPMQVPPMHPLQAAPIAGCVHCRQNPPQARCLCDVSWVRLSPGADGCRSARVAGEDRSRGGLTTLSVCVL